ncbi:MAG: class I SAM-dependent methyltransferase [Verrucomicrobia bacterium]|nr:class I SAM-dependent methyltransferase [Verrucomicrobiota bacterium]
MKHIFPHLVTLSFVLTVTLLPPGHAADAPAVSEAAREQFIRNFKRTILNTTPGDAMLLRILVQSSGAKRGVEVGSATGYGALQMGVGFERNGGHLITVDIDPEMVRATRDNLRKTGLDQTVTVIEGDALKVLPALEGEFDFVFLDAVKRDYLQYLKALEPKLKPGALVVADNVIQSAGQMRDYLDHVQDPARYETVIIRASDEKGDGMAISYKRR